VSVESMLAEIGMTPEQVRRTARRCSRRPPPDPDEGEPETGDDLVEAINENRPAGLSNPADAIDAAYHGAVLRD
jgi:hypothetical protein